MQGVGPERRKELDLECRENIRRRRNFTHNGSVGFGVVVLWGRPGREAGADRGCDVGEGRSPFPPAPCRQDGGLTTVGFLGLMGRERVETLAVGKDGHEDEAQYAIT
jgi:hypothetical protein